MAAQIVSRRKRTRAPEPHFNTVTSHDRNDELQAACQCRELKKNPKSQDSTHLSDGPVNVSSAVLMGNMPKPDKILKHGTLAKLTSTYEWKPMSIALTSAGLFFARPGEDVLRDLIPLFEIVDVKKRNDIPGEAIPGSTLASPDRDAIQSGRQGSTRNLRISTLMEQELAEPMHLIQLRSLENGYNSGRTYYLRAESDDACNDWLQHLRTASEHAVMLKSAGPSLLRRMRYRLRRFYHSWSVQGVVAFLIFSSFVIEIAQAELAGAADSPVFAAFEVAFTVIFCVELVVNFLANYFRPFFKVHPLGPI
jgi:hypothetical protein